jgi:hypothetical protein
LQSLENSIARHSPRDTAALLRKLHAKIAQGTPLKGQFLGSKSCEWRYGRGILISPLSSSLRELLSSLGFFLTEKLKIKPQQLGQPEQKQA